MRRALVRGDATARLNAPAERDRGQGRAGAGRRAPPVAIAPGTIWHAAAAGVVLLVVWVLFARASGALMLIFVAVTFAEGIRPMVDWLERAGLPRPAGVLLLYVAIAMVLAGLGWLLLQPLASQLASLLDSLPQIAAEAERLIDQVRELAGNNPQVSSALEVVPQQVAGLAREVLVRLLGTPMLLLDALFRFIEIYLLAFFWLTAAGGLKPFLLSLLPAGAGPEAEAVIGELSHKLGGVLRGTVIDMAAIALLSGGGLALLGVPYPILLAFVAGLAEALPLFGPWIAGACAVAVALPLSGTTKALEVVALYVGIHLLEGNTLVPLVMYRTTDLNPVLIITAIVLGGTLLGIVGAVLAVPAAIVVQVLVVRVLAPAVRRQVARDGVVERERRAARSRRLR